MMKLKRTIAALVALAIIAACAASLALTGDVDGDGAIGVKDAVLLCRAIADGGAGANDMLSMDVDADGRLTVADLRLYLPRHNGQQRGFPARCAERRIQQGC